jgi:mutator protein MutT
MEIQKQNLESSNSNDCKTPINVACLVLVDRTGAVLITQRPIEKSLGGLWEFPGGKVETGESAEVALRREIIEELQIEVGLLHPMLPVTHVYEFGTIQLIPFLSKCHNRPPIQLVEHSDLAWVEHVNLLDYEWAPADLPIVENLRAILGGNGIQPSHPTKK